MPFHKRESEIETTVELQTRRIPQGFLGTDEVSQIYYLSDDIVMRAAEVTDCDATYNTFGKKLDPLLTSAQERLTAEFDHDELGLLCRGAAGLKDCGFKSSRETPKASLHAGVYIPNPGEYRPQISVHSGCNTALIAREDAREFPYPIENARGDRVADNLCLRKFETAAQRLAQLFVEEVELLEGQKR